MAENIQGIPLWGWIVFGVSVVVLLALDLFAHRGKHGGSRRSAYIWSCIWIAAGLLFAIFVWLAVGARQAHEYLAAYLIEKSLSLDNLFVFLIIFRNLSIPQEYQHNVLYWGIFGALVFRAVFIFLGIAAVERFEWVTYVFAAILLLAAWQSFREDPAGKKTNKAVEWLSAHLPFTGEIQGTRFFVRENGRLLATVAHRSSGAGNNRHRLRHRFGPGRIVSQPQPLRCLQFQRLCHSRPARSLLSPRSCPYRTALSTLRPGWSTGFRSR